MFGGFSQVPRKMGQQQPLGVVSTPLDALKPAQRPLGVIPSPIGQGSAPGSSGDHLKASQVEAEWTGVIHGWSGYAKANREILKRASVFAKIRISDQAPWDPEGVSQDIQALYNFHRGLQVSPQAPKIRFLPPEVDVQAGYRVIYTMMESEKVHPGMIAIMNERYDECWVPTRWNARTFAASGLTIPTYVMPLGVDPGVYNGKVHPALPKALVMTGKNAGRYEVPSGFLFISVFQPSFRKGYDVMVKTFEDTFGGDQEVGLILGTTAYSLPTEFPWNRMKSRIWLLSGTYGERQLASIYKACKVYLCTSRGEGWNLTLDEAAAVGLPVIVPRTSVHPELIPEDLAYYFDKDSDRVFPESKKMYPFYDGIPFPDYGPRSQKQVANLMRHVKKNYKEACEVGKKLQAHVIGKYTWSMAARKVADRIRAICAR